MADLDDQHRHYQLIAQAIAFINERQAEQPQLKDLAEYMGFSEAYLQKTFREWAGISPKQFLQFLSHQKARSILKETSVTDAAYASGFSSGSRLYDLMVNIESVTPGEYKSGGLGIKIDYGIHPSPFGMCLIAITKRGLCKLAFFDSPSDEEEVIKELFEEWPNAEIKIDQATTRDTLNKIFGNEKQPISVLSKGTPFQILVWEALLKIPEGDLLSYQQVAEKIGKPTATRAVASAIAKNTIAYFIPCHRVIRSTGEINQYRWGTIRKQALISRECSAS